MGTGSFGDAMETAPPGTGERGCVGMAAEYWGGAKCGRVEGVKLGGSWLIHMDLEWFVMVN